MMVQYNFLKSWLQAHTTSERGASLVEYALLVALIAVVCIAAIGVLSGGVKKTFSDTGSSLSGATP
ncbi:MAG: Flp family type IVb pilin [Microthrixaceae bacterium]